MLLVLHEVGAAELLTFIHLLQHHVESAIPLVAGTFQAIPHYFSDTAAV